MVGSSGAPNWAGGSNDCSDPNPTGIFALCPTTLAPRPLPWGSPEFIGLGFLSFVSIVLTEIFGSPFLKNVSIIVGLVVGCIVAGAAGYIDGSSIQTAPAITFLWWVSPRPMWLLMGIVNRVHTFKIRVYPPAILPSRYPAFEFYQFFSSVAVLAVYVSTTMEAIGDVTASAEVSRVPVVGPEFDSRIQGGVLVNITLSSFYPCAF